MGTSDYTFSLRPFQFLGAFLRLGMLRVLSVARFLSGMSELQYCADGKCRKRANDKSANGTERGREWPCLY